MTPGGHWVTNQSETVSIWKEFIYKWLCCSGHAAVCQVYKIKLYYVTLMPKLSHLLSPYNGGRNRHSIEADKGNDFYGPRNC